MPKQSHVHKLKKHKYATGNAVFFCTLADCHYKVEVPFALGKRSICNICGKEFVISENTLKLARPHCNECGKVRVKDADGNNRYVKKVANKILTGIAQNTNKDLRSRLEAVIATELDEDI